MGSKTKKKAQAKAGKVNKGSKAKAGLNQSAVPAAAGATQSQFVKGLLVRGEAAKLTPDGKLPLQATHIIETENKDGSAGVRRARFKLF